MAYTITNGLCSLADVKAALRLTDTADDDRVGLAIDAASRQIERRCGRRFWQDTTTSARTFVADTPFLCEVDDFWPASTTIAAASNGLVLPQGTITVASTTGFATAGTLSIAASPTAAVTYTGITATTFTGCTGGTGALATGENVSAAVVVQTDPNGDGSFSLTWSPLDYQLEPLNALVEGHPWPYTQLRAVRSLLFPVYGGIAYPLPYVQALTRVTAQWGWQAVPSDVQKAAIAQAMMLFKSDDVPFGATAFGETGIVRFHAALNPTAEALIAPYVETGIRVA